MWGVGLAVAHFLLSAQMAALFSKDPEAVRVLTQYLSIVPIGYGMMEIHRYVGFSFNAVARPISSVWINVVRIVVLLVPLSCLGSWYFGLIGVFWGRVVADIVSASVALLWAHQVFRCLAESQPGVP